ncbi:MAG TPA: DUF975 family protein [Bacilli bacterium]|nr:DUF975 family protein [Bacilli bacterium]
MNLAWIKRDARKELHRHFGKILFALLLWLGAFLLSSLTIVGPLLLGGALTVSMAAFFIDVAEEEYFGDTSFAYVFRGFNQFKRSLVVYFYAFLLFVLFSSVLSLFFYVFRVPLLITSTGWLNFKTIFATLVVIAGTFLFYLTIYFVFHVAADPNYRGVTVKEIFKGNWRIIKAHFWDIVKFELSFILWYIGVALTFGLLLIYVIPYRAVAKAGLYKVAVWHYTP